MQIVMVLLFAGALLANVMIAQAPEPGQFDGRGDTHAVNLGVYHQAAVAAAQGLGGASYTGPIADATVAPSLPAWFVRTAPWSSAADAGLVATCLTAIPVNMDVGKVFAALFKRSANDPGAGAAAGGAFQSISGVSTTLTGRALPLGCAQGSPVYVSVIG